MNIQLNYFLVLSAILIIPLIPIYLYLRDFKKTFYTACAIGFFMFLNRQFLCGHVGAYHDSRFTYEYFLLILNQWIDSGIPLGWNPYMNAGEPLFLFSNYFLRAPWIYFCFANIMLNINPHTLFNLYWGFLFISFCTGSLLLFLELHKNFIASYFSFLTLLLSGMFLVNLGQPTGIYALYFFPYILFIIIRSYRKKKYFGLCIAFLLAGIAVNYYLPHYLFFSLAATIGCLLLFKFIPGIFPIQYKVKTFAIITLTIIIFILVAAPALYMFGETKNYVSPTRGSTKPRGAITYDKGGFQGSVNAPLWGYKIFLTQETKYRKNIHHAFYIGILPLLFIPLAIFNAKSPLVKTLFLCSVLSILMGLGKNFFVYRILHTHIPLFNLIRHTFCWAQYATYFMICLTGFGFKVLFTKPKPSIKILVTLIPTICFILLLLIRHSKNVVIYGLLGIAFLSIHFFISNHSIQRSFIPTILLLIALQICDLAHFYDAHSSKNLLSTQPLPLKEFRYPLIRSAYSKFPYPKPPDLSPLIFKKAILTHSKPDYIIFRNKRLHHMITTLRNSLVGNTALGVRTPFFYFTSHAHIINSPNIDEFIHTLNNTFTEKAPQKEYPVFFIENEIDFPPSPLTISSPNSLILAPKTRPNPNQIEVMIRTNAQGYLVRWENFDSHWKAFVDDVPTPIYRANYAFQAIRVHAGTHRVRFEFQSLYPILFKFHLIATALTWILFLVFLYKNPQTTPANNGLWKL